MDNVKSPLGITETFQQHAFGTDAVGLIVEDYMNTADPLAAYSLNSNTKPGFGGR